MKDIPALLLAQHLIREANCCMRRPIWVRRTRRWMEAVPSRKHQHWTDRHIGKNHDILHDERLVKDHRAIARGIIPGGIYPPGKRFAVPAPETSITLWVPSYIHNHYNDLNQFRTGGILILVDVST